MTAIWSKRWTVAHGWRWTRERDASEHEASAWLAVFRNDEPLIDFVAAERRPVIKTTKPPAE